MHGYQIILQCYNNLGQWSRLKNLTLQSIDEESPSDIGKIWDDVYLQVFLHVNSNFQCHELMQHWSFPSSTEAFGIS